MEEKQGNTKMFRISDKENWHSLSLFYNNFLQNGFVEEKFGPIMIILFLKKDHEGSFSIFECKWPDRRPNLNVMVHPYYILYLV